MKNILAVIISSTLFASITYSQVGIGTANPTATLEIIKQTTLAPGEFDGVIIPKVNNLPAGSLLPGAAQKGLLIYLEDGSANEGFYYFDGTAYVKISGGSAFYNYNTTTFATSTIEDIVRTGKVSIGTGINSGKLTIVIPTSDDLDNRIGLRIDNANRSTSVRPTYGIFSENRSVPTGTKYGIKTEVSSGGEGDHVGIKNTVYDNNSASNGGSVIGIDNFVGPVNGTSAGIENYGIKSVIGNSSSTGPIYGIYSEANGTSTNTSVYGALINGRLSIGNRERTTGYDFPTDRGTTGQILTTDGNGTATWSGPIATRATLAANQTIGGTSSDWIKLNFGNSVINLGSGFNNTSNRFIAPIAGVYRVYAQYHSVNSYITNNYAGISIHLNNNLYSEHSVNHQENGQIYRSITSLVNMNAGDFIEIFYRSDDAGMVADSFTGKTFFEVEKLR